MKVALVHEWVAQWGGSEAVLAELADLYPEAPIYLGLWKPDPKGLDAFGDRSIRTTRLQRLLPLVGGDHRRLLPFMPGAFRALDLRRYDVVISSSHAFSKAVRTGPDTRHVCYCHSPPRWLWDLYDTYNPGWKGKLGRPLARRLRRLDERAAGGVDRFVANSRTVADRIRRHYDRDAEVIHPPVMVERYGRAAAAIAEAGRGPASFFLAGGRMVRYKRMEVLVRAARLGGFELKVFGDGPERAALQAAAGATVEFLGVVHDQELARLMARCRAFLFAAEEDFGILPVEAQAAGRPVVAWGRGGATETVVDGETGLLLEEGTPEAFVEGVRRVEERSWDSRRIRAHADRFAAERFREGIVRVVEGE